MFTKKDYHKNINKRFYNFVETNFPEYEIDSNEGGGRIYLIPKDGDGANNSIEYHQSHHDVICFKHASPKTHGDVDKMEKYINNSIIPYVKILFGLND
jgi:hypothetical protein